MQVDGQPLPLPTRRRRAGHAGWLLPLLIVALTVGLGLTFWHTLDRAADRRTVAAAADEVDQVITRLAQQATPAVHYQELLERLVATIRWREDPWPLLRDETDPAVLLFRFDRAGRRIDAPGFSAAMRRTSERFLALLRDRQRRPDQAWSASDRTLAVGFAGSTDVVPFMARRPGRLLNLSLMGSRRLGGWFPLRDRRRTSGYLLAWIDLERLDQDGLARRAIRRARQLLGPAWGLGYVDLLRTGSRSPHPPTAAAVGPKPRDDPWFTTRPLSPAWRQELLRHRLSAVARHRRHLVGIADLPTHRRLFAIRHRPAPARGWLRSRPVVAGVGLLLLLTVGAGWWWSGRGWSLPVRVRLMLVFGGSALLGIAALLGAAGFYRDGREQLLLRTRQHEAIEILGKIDSDFAAAYARLMQPYRRLTDLGRRRPDLLPRLLRPLRRPPPGHPLYAAFLFDLAGNTIDQAVFATRFGINRFIDATHRVARNSAIRYLARYWGREPPKDLENPFAFFGSGDFEGHRFPPMRLAYRSMDFAEEFVLYRDVITDASGLRPVAWLACYHDPFRMELAWLRHAERAMRRHSTWRLVAIPRPNERPLPAYPPGLAREAGLRRIHDRVTASNAVHHQRERLGRHDLLVTGLPGQQLVHYNLFLLTPYHPIEAELARLGGGIRLLAVVALSFGLALAWILAGSLLPPISGLDAGVRHLVDMRLDFSPRRHADDELGDLTDGIAGIITDLRELEMARQVQEHLLPAQPLSLGDVSSHAWGRTAGAVGGIFCDHRRLASGRLAAMLAASAGGTVRSALLMAMCRVAWHLVLEEPPSVDIAAGTERLRQFVATHWHEAWEISIGAVIVDPDRGTGEFLLVGDLAARQITTAGGVTRLQPAGPAIGPRQAAPARPVALVLAAGERLLLGTRLLLDTSDRPAEDGIQPGARPNHPGSGGDVAAGSPMRATPPDRPAGPGAPVVASLPCTAVGPALFARFDRLRGHGSTPTDEAALLISRQPFPTDPRSELHDDGPIARRETPVSRIATGPTLAADHARQGGAA